MQAQKAPDLQSDWTWRVEHIPKNTTPEQLKSFFIEDDQSRITDVKSLVPESITPDIHYHGLENYELTATISFRSLKGQKPRLIDKFDGIISVDANFYGFTPLSCPNRETPIAADIIAVTGLAGHAFGSWSHSRTKMWLRDYLPPKVTNVRVLTYGYPSHLQRSMSTSNLWDHSNNLKENLLAIRSAAQVVVDANRAKFSLPLPVHSLIFLGAPHRGLETTALKALVEGTASANMIRDLEEGSNTLAMLDDDFKKYHQESSIHILSFYELYKTPTAHQSSDGSWKRDGVPKMMVTRDRAHLGYEDTILGVYANHSEIAKIDLSSNSQFLFIKQTIDQVLLKTSEQGVFLGLSPFQSSEDAHSLRSKSAVTLPGNTERPITRSGPDHREQHSRSTPTIVLGRSRTLDEIRKPTPEAQSSDLDRMNMRRRNSGSGIIKERSKLKDENPRSKAIDCETCNRCRKPIYKVQWWYCNICKKGNYGLCRDCEENNITCEFDSHELTTESIKNSKDTDPAVPESTLVPVPDRPRRPERVGENIQINRAIYVGSNTEVRRLSSGPLLNKADAQGNTPLMVAAATDQEQVVDHLITRGAALNFVGPKTYSFSLCMQASWRRDRTPLMSSMYNPTAGVADVVLDSTGNEEVVDGGENNRFTTLQPGATHSRVLELLLKHEADVRAIPTKASGARNPLRLALQYCRKQYYSHRKFRELLVKYAANMEQPDGNEDTPLHWAAKNAVPEIVE
ncbi:MAG: hypothetical protein ASARMPRED_009298 [Alectoria sarmentosa]|nr:MAG: hypothetical protein ASARMPRED_009298 [Alectoria sarmentosa]